MTIRSREHASHGDAIEAADYFQGPKAWKHGVICSCFGVAMYTSVGAGCASVSACRLVGILSYRSSDISVVCGRIYVLIPDGVSKASE